MSLSLVGALVCLSIRHMPKGMHTLLWHTQHIGAGGPPWTWADRAVPGWTLVTAIQMIFSVIFRHLECSSLQLKPIPRCASRRGVGWTGACRLEGTCLSARCREVSGKPSLSSSASSRCCSERVAEERAFLQLSSDCSDLGFPEGAPWAVTPTTPDIQWIWDEEEGPCGSTLLTSGFLYMCFQFACP